MEDKKKSPELRFTGFTDDWKEQELGEILTERSEMQKISEDAPILAFAAGQGVIDRSERKSNNRDHLTHDQENKIYKLTELDDIVYNPSNLKYGAIDRNKHGRGVISPIYVTFTTQEEPSFIELIVKDKKFKHRALQYEEGTVVKRQSVKPENLLTLSVSISPSRDEQKKIGSFFKNIDELITKHKKKHDRLVTLKKSMLEKMFPKEGQTVPEIRFKGFEGHWIENRIDEVAKVYDGTHQTPKYTDSGVMFLSVENIKDLESQKYISVDDFEEEFKVYPQRGDLLMTRIGDIGTVNVVETDVPLAYYVSLALIKCNDLDPYFLSQCLASEPVKNDIWKRTLHIAFPKKINKGEIEKVTIIHPKSIDEQKAIGSFFKDLDSLISSHKKQLQKLTNFKQSLLEKMFV